MLPAISLAPLNFVLCGFKFGVCSRRLSLCPQLVEAPWNLAHTLGMVGSLNALDAPQGLASTVSLPHTTIAALSSLLPATLRPAPTLRFQKTSQRATKERPPREAEGLPTLFPSVLWP